MLTFPKPLTDAEAVKEYYEKDELAKEPGKWYGKGAEALGLSGVARREDFHNLIEGKAPDGRQLVSSGVEGKHRVGMDLTFSDSKSVSIMALNDKRIIEAKERAVARALDHIEREYAKTRDQSGGKTTVVDTGNLVVYRIGHLTSREYDPQLHTHCLVMNMTQKADGTWRSLQFDEFYKERFTNAMGVYYRLEMIKELRALGYAIEITDRSKGLYEIKGVPKDLIEEFSKRTEKINDKLKELKSSGKYSGETEAELLQRAVLATRPLKDDAISGESMLEEYISTIVSKGYTLEGIRAECERQAAEAGRERVYEMSKSKYDCVREAAMAITATEAVFSFERLLEQAQYLGMGRFDGEEIFNTIKELTAKDPKTLSKEKDKELVVIGRNAYTTREMLAIEREIVTRVKRGGGTRGFLSPMTVSAFIEEKKTSAARGSGMAYGKDQVAAIRTVCESADLVTGVQGDAGAGKTTLLRGVKELHEANDWQVLGMSNTGKASEELRKGAQIITHTIAGFLKWSETKKFGEEIKKNRSLWIIDEAGQTGSKDLGKLYRLADQYGAKLVLVGDRKQFLSVAAGRMFSLFQETGAVKFAKLTEVHRQKTEYMIEAVRLVSGAGRMVEKAVEAYEKETGRRVMYPESVAEKFTSLVQAEKWGSIQKSPVYKGILAVLVGKNPEDINKIDLPALKEKLAAEVKEMADIDRAFDVLKNNDRVVEVGDRDERLHQVAEEYLKAEAEGKKALVITALNKDRRELNKIIRGQLAADGKVATGKEFTVTASAGIDPTKLHYADSFRAKEGDKNGHQIVLLKEITSVDGVEINSGARGEVVGRDVEKNTLTVAFEKKGDKLVVELDVSRYADSLSVFEQEKISLAENDRVVFLKNDKKLGVQNGVCGTILKVDSHGNCSVRLDSEKADDARTVKFNLSGLDHKGGVAYNFINHGYAVTEYKSQGQTVSEIIWHADTIARNTFNSFYVALTRAMHEVKIFASDVAELIGQVKEEQEKTSTQDHHVAKVIIKEAKDKESDLNEGAEQTL